MALEFRRRRLPRPGKKTLYTLAVLALLAALVAVAAWIVIRYHEQDPLARETDTSPASDASDNGFTDADRTELMVVIPDAGEERFVLLQSDPAAGAAVSIPIAGDLDLGDGQTPVSLYRKSGILRTVEGITSATAYAPRHYVVLTAANAEKWINHLEGGIPYALPEDVDFTDPTGAIVRLSAGEHNLTATQAVSLLRYTGWHDPATGERLCADLVAAMLNRYLKSGRDLEDDFTVLSNLAKTDLRIGDFRQRRAALTHIAAINTGTLCRTYKEK